MLSCVDLHSTTLLAAAYHDHRARLELKFSSQAVYHYFDVPPHTYQELLRAKSKGEYFNRCIRNRFAYTKIHSALSTPLRADCKGTP